jgi:O-glycosyl hydrolase
MNIIRRCANALRWASILFILSGCAAPAEVNNPVAETPPQASEAAQPTKTPFIRRLEVFPDQPLQTIREIGGGNFIHMFGGVTDASDPISDRNLNTLEPAVARVSINLDLWEPRNDDADPRNMRTDGFKDEEDTFIRGTFEFMRQMKAGGTILVASVWRMPAWLVENPDDDSQQIIPVTLYPEVVESLAAWLLHARDQYGVEVAYISFNEANLGINVLLTPEEYIEIIRLSGARFAELGLKTRWLLADSSNMGSALAYAEAIYSAQDIHPFLGVFAFHSWDAMAGDDTLQKLGEFAQKNHLEVWCTEGGWDPSMWERPEQFSTWAHALNLAAVYTRVIKATRATTFLYWQMMGTDYMLNDGAESYPALNVLSAYQTYFPAGSTIVNTSADGNQIKFTAQKGERGFSLVVVNRDAFTEQAQVTGLPDGSYRWLRYSATENGLLVGEITVSGGLLSFELLKSSVNFFTTIPTE